MKRLLGIITSLRKFCQIVAVLLFFLYWPAANLYWVACAAFGFIGKAIGGNTIGEAFVVISVLMAFLLPIWALSVIGIYYLATAFAIASLHPVPLLLLLVAFLERKNHIPIGHIGINDVGKMWEGGFSNWLYPTLYSILAMLGGVLVLLSLRRKLARNVR